MEMARPPCSSDWRPLYTAATLESDTKKLQERIQQADGAMRERLKHLRQTTSHASEKMELESSLAYLCLLKDNLRAE